MPDGAQFVVMTHSRALDLEIVSAALGQRRFSFVGLIGSATKRARFLSQMRAAGLSEEALARLVCPIGLPGVEGKEPPVIAAARAPQLLIARGSQAAPAKLKGAPQLAPIAAEGAMQSMTRTNATHSPWDEDLEG